MNMITVSEKGQIAIPRTVRELLGIEQGDALFMTVVKDKIILEKADRTEKRIKDEFIDILKHTENSLKTVWDNKSDDVWERYLK